MTRITTPKTRYLHDFKVGEVLEFGDTLVTAEEIVEFASKYDPQSFHLTEEAGRASHFGGLCASGWMTCAIMMRQLVDHFISPESSMGSPGVDEIRWIKPVMAGDRLHTRLSITEVRASQSKPDRGIIKYDIAMFDQSDAQVFAMKGMGMVKTRPSVA